MGGVEFNPNVGGDKFKTKDAGKSGNYNSRYLVLSRSAAEGPATDELTLSGKEKAETSNWMTKVSQFFFDTLWGNNTSEIKFLKEPFEIDKRGFSSDKNLVISEPFTAESPEKADQTAVRIYNTQKGHVQRLTGELYMNVGAQPLDDGRYVIVAGGTI